MTVHLPLPTMTAKELKKFWLKIGVRGHNDCWLWKEHRDKDGYAPFRMRGRRYKAARVALFLATGRDPGELLACHTCNNPPCCNPRHLYAGTCAENLQQAVEQQRAFVGAKNGRAKLTPHNVRYIRTTNIPASQLAIRLGVTRGTISKIRRHHLWKYIA